MLSSPVAANVTGDERLELILGNEIYEVNITDRTSSSNQIIMTKTISPPNEVVQDGHTQLADFNNDGHLDVFISNRTGYLQSATVHAYIWDVYNDTVSLPLSIPTSHSGKSFPLIADVNKNGKLDILIQCGVQGSDKKYMCYEYDSDEKSFTFLWDFKPSEDSFSNTATLFDFNMDGNNEVLLTDQVNIRIIEAETGDPMSALPFSENTFMQYPVIADVDYDGSSEIVAVGSNQLNIFKSSTSMLWAPSRRVWNQYAYNAVNVNEDLTIPRYPLDPATVFPGIDGQIGTEDDVRPYNNFLQQQTVLNTNGNPFWPAPDTKLAETPVFNYYGYGDSLVISVNVTNIGDAALIAPFYVSAYKDAVSVGNDMATDSSMTSLNVADTVSMTITVRNLSSYLPIDNIIIRINDRGLAEYVQPECEDDNNDYEYPHSILLIVRNDSVAILYNSDTTVNVKLNDLIPSNCSAVIPSIPLAPSIGAAEIAHDSIKYTVDNDSYGVDSLVYRLTCTSQDTVSKAEAKVYIIVSKPLSDSYIDCIDSTVKAGFEHIDDVEYYWYTSETEVTASSGSPSDTRECTAPSEWWVEVRYRGNAVMPRFKVAIDAYPALTAGSIAADQTICSGKIPETFTSQYPAAGGDVPIDSYLWQYRTGESAWTTVPGATSNEYTPAAAPAVTTYYRRGAKNGCGTVYTDSVTVTVLSTSLFNYPDIRIRICPDPDKNVNLSKYIDTVSLKSVQWTSVSPHVPISDPDGAGIISTNSLKTSTVYTFTYIAGNDCAENIQRKFYLETLKPERMRPLRDTIVICYEYAEAIQLNQLFGIEAGGEWSFEPDVTSYITKSSSPSSNYFGAVVMNGKAIYLGAVPAYTYHGVTEAKRVKVTYTPANDSCLAGNPYSIVIILTPDIMK
jgi:hypothetical protein